VRNIWKEVKGQVVLGRDEFVGEIIELIKDKKELKEIPRKQRHIGRPSLETLFAQQILKDRAERNKRIYYSRVSRIVKREEEKAKGKT